MLRSRSDRFITISRCVKKNGLPLAALSRISHSVNILTYRGPDPRLRSVIDVVGAKDTSPWQLLAQHTHCLANYRITQAEVALDLPLRAIADAEATVLRLAQRLDKPWHQRGDIRLVYAPTAVPPPGCVDFPTIYYEHRRSSVGLKCYVRKRKCAAGKFGSLCVRIEWTLTGRRALTRHLGGIDLHSLSTDNLTKFINRNLRLVQVDYAALGKLFKWKNLSGEYHGPWAQPEYRARRALHMLTAHYFGSNLETDQSDWWRMMREVFQTSPAQVRGLCRRWWHGGSRKKSLASVSDYRINACFHRV